MKSQKTKNVLLGIIAFNLTLISCFQLDLLGTNAYANNNNTLSNINYGLVPLNDDGSINIKLSENDLEILKPLQNTSVDLRKIAGWDVAFSKSRSGKAVLWTFAEESNLN
tara:strand:+ start:233 stop:562 length:330 start_codon:yes stop_codon:yes gene_type:complete